jgi:5S rRNA maturation endonuclease (ribonuclease M5)
VFNFQQFLEDFNIPIPENNKNTGIGWINIQCPFCNDDKNHLGFNYEENYFHCWKCSDGLKGGYHPIKEVIEKLVPFENAEEILNKYDTDQIIINKIHKKLNKIKVKSIELPGGKLKPIHKEYLLNRNFDPNYLESKYKLKGTTHLTNYKYRIIIPIYFQNKVVSFQTRSLNNINRYINCDPDKEIIPIKDVLYNYDNCKKDYCILTEGVFKVFRLGDNSLASLGKNYTKNQIKLLTRFKIVFIFFDPDLPGQNKAEKLSLELDGLGIKTYNILHEKAPDNLTKKEVIIIKSEIEDIIKNI